MEIHKYTYEHVYMDVDTGYNNIGWVKGQQTFFGKRSESKYFRLFGVCCHIYVAMSMSDIDIAEKQS